MKYNIKIYLILLLFIIILAGTVSATDNIETGENENPDILTNPISNTEHVITQSNYNTYFDEDGNILSVIDNGDTLKLSGTFDDKKFIINKNVTVIGDNVEIKQGTVAIISGASGTTVSNLKIINDGSDLQGIFLSQVTNCLIKDNNITSCGQSSFPIALNPGANYNIITNNILKSSGVSLAGTTKSTCTIVLGEAHYNTISNNYLEVDDANAIYLSKYGSGSFVGGQSNYNVIFNNTIKCMVVPTSWCYGIQMMGSNNKADSNTIIGTYRGISGEQGSIVTNNKLINLTGKDFATGKIVGGDNGIIVGANSNISSNVFVNCLIEQSGISAADNSIVKNNTVRVTGTGYGIAVNGNNVKVIDNNVQTVSGACVYQAGKLKNLYVDGNVLNSDTGVGVLVVKTSASKYPTNITIINNEITTTNQYAINAKDANKSSYLIKNNVVGSSKILSPDGEIVPEPDFNFNGTTYNVDPDNYHAFFDDNGNLINILVKDGDILNFTGVFEDKYPIISYSIKLTGYNATFKNSEIKVTSDSVWIENLTIINTNASLLNTWGIFAESISKIMIYNNDIFVYDKNAAYTIYLNGVTKATIKDNNLSSSGDYLTYPVLLYGVEKSVVENNKILANGTGQVHGYEATKCLDGEKCLDGNHMVSEIYRTYGILLITSSENNIISNDVTVTSKLNQSQPKINGSLSTNSIVGIDAYHDSNDNIFEGNNVLVYGNDNYIYGMGVLGAETGSGKSQYSQNNQFINNDITVKGENMGTGLISGYHAENNIFVNNTVSVTTNNSAYGVTLEYGKDSTVSGNNISLKSDIVYGIEMFEGDNNVISANLIKTESSYAFGMGGYRSINNTIMNNKINVNSSADKPISLVNHTDALGFGNAGVIFKANSTKNVIEDNEIITTKGVAVNLTDTSNNKVIHNYLKGENTAGDDSVIYAANNIVEDNYGNEFFNATLINSTSIYLGQTTLVANSGIKNDNKTNVKFYVNGEYVGNTTVIDGKATLKVNLSNIVGNYEIIAEFSRKNYNTVNITAKLAIIKGNITVNVPDVSGKKGTGMLLQAIVKDSFGNPVENMEVIFSRGSNYVGKVTTNAQGVAEFIWKSPAAITGETDILNVVVSGNELYNSGNGSGRITYNNITQSTLKVSDLIKYYKNASQLKGSLSDLNGNPISGVKLSIKLNDDNYYRTTDEKGNFLMDINLNSGNYEAFIKFDGNSLYSNANTTTHITVLSTVYGNDTVLYFKNGTKYNALFLDGQGNPLEGANVRFNINGVFYYRTTDAKGMTSGLAMNLNPGNYTITAIASNGEMHSNIITILPTIISSDFVKYYKNDSKFVVKIVDGHGNALVGQKVTYNINGVFYERTTGANGTAIFNINLGAGNSIPNQYIITVSCNGCTVSNYVTVLPILTADNLVAIYNNKDKFNVKLVDGQGKPLSGANIEFNINGVFYYRTTNVNGTTSGLTINLMPGEYIITSICKDNGAVISNKVVVKS